MYCSRCGIKAFPRIERMVNGKLVKEYCCVCGYEWVQASLPEGNLKDL